MQIPGPQMPKLARQLSAAEREDSILKRKRPAEANTVLTIAGVYNGNEIASWTEDQKALHTAKQKNFSTWTCVVWWKWSTGRNHNKFSRHTGYKNKG